MKIKILLPLLFIQLIVCVSCNNNSSNNNNQVVFNPKTPQSQILDADREAKIAEKRAQYKSMDSYESILANSYKFEGKIKLTTFVPNDENMTATEARLIDFKTIQMVTANGIGGLGGNPRFIIAPLYTILQKDVTSNAPIKYLVKFDVTFYVADLLTGTIFATYGMQKTGVGESETRAFVSMFNEIDPRDEGIQRFLEEAQNKIISFYDVHAKEMIAEAERYATLGQNESAIAILNSIPVECAEHYATATKLASKYYGQIIERNCSQYLARMKAALGRPIDSTGFNAEAMCYYSMITEGGACKKEADKIYNEYKKEIFLDQERKRKYLIEDRQWNLQVYEKKADIEYRDKQLEYAHEYEMFRTEMYAKVQIAGNTCLLEKYKKDAYNNLSFINKIFNLGSAFEGSQCGKEPEF